MPGVSRHKVEDAYFRFVLPLTVQAMGREVLHASAVLGANGVIAICGDSGAGKSTIGYGLTNRGHRPWADDAVSFEARGDDLVAVPLPFFRRLRNDAIEYFGPRAQPLRQDAIRSRPTRLRSGPKPFAAVFVVKKTRTPSRGRPVELRRIPPAEAFTTVLPYCQPFTLRDVERKRRMVAQYLRLSSTVPVLELRFVRDLAKLPLVLDAIEDAVERLPRSRSRR